jgi:integrase
MLKASARSAAASRLWIPDGKTPNARRRLRVPDEVLPLMQRLTRGHAADALLIGTARTTPYTNTVLWKHLRTFCRLAGVRRVCPHSLRGLHSTLAMEAGSTSGVVIAQLGHSSFQVTQRHYLDRDRHRAVSMAKVAGALLRPRDELQEALADLSANEVRELLSTLRSRRGAA